MKTSCYGSILPWLTPVNCKIILKSAHGAYHICLSFTFSLWCVLSVTPSLTRARFINHPLAIASISVYEPLQLSTRGWRKTSVIFLVFTRIPYNILFLFSLSLLFLSQACHSSLASLASLVNRVDKKLLKLFSTWSYRLERLSLLNRPQQKIVVRRRFEAT